MRARVLSLLALAVLLSTTAQADRFHHEVKMGNASAVCAMLRDNPRLANTRDVLGYTPLNIAVVNGHTDIVQLLLIRGAFVNAAARANGDTPLEEAVISDNLAITKILLAHGANVTLRDHAYHTPLWWAHRDTMPPSPQILALLHKSAAHSRAGAD